MIFSWFYATFAVGVVIIPFVKSCYFNTSPFTLFTAANEFNSLPLAQQRIMRILISPGDTHVVLKQTSACKLATSRDRGGTQLLLFHEVRDFCVFIH